MGWKYHVGDDCDAYHKPYGERWGFRVVFTTPEWPSAQIFLAEMNSNEAPVCVLYDIFGSFAERSRLCFVVPNSKLSGRIEVQSLGLNFNPRPDPRCKISGKLFCGALNLESSIWAGIEVQCSGLDFNTRDACGLLPKHRRKHVLYLTSVILFQYCTRTMVQSVHIHTYRVVV